MDTDTTPHCNDIEQASMSATSESEQPMEVDHEDHKKCARVPNKVSIKETASTPGSPETGSPDQKCHKNDESDTSVTTVVNWELFP